MSYQGNTARPYMKREVPTVRLREMATFIQFLSCCYALSRYTGQPYTMR